MSEFVTVGVISLKDADVYLTHPMLWCANVSHQTLFALSIRSGDGDTSAVLVDWEQCLNLLD